MGDAAGAVSRDLRSVGIGEEHAGAPFACPVRPARARVDLRHDTFAPAGRSGEPRLHIYYARGIRAKAGRFARIGPRPRSLLRYARSAGTPGDGRGILCNLGDR